MVEVYGGFTEKGRMYHVITCRNCKAAVTMTDSQYKGLWAKLSPLAETCNRYFDCNLSCCFRPEYFWGLCL